LDSDDKVLLVKRTKMYRGWALPGGTVEANESFESAFTREIEEEIGLEPHNVNLIAVEQKIFSCPSQESFDFLLCVFTARVHSSGTPIPTQDAIDEGLSVEVFDLDHLPETMILGDKDQALCQIRHLEN
jgi:ADP-ribose pyrophosphatase YjhB (NUDIX family)